jgi:hypothetical protein
MNGFLYYKEPQVHLLVVVSCTETSLSSNLSTPTMPKICINIYMCDDDHNDNNISRKMVGSSGMMSSSISTASWSIVLSHLCSKDCIMAKTTIMMQNNIFPNCFSSSWPIGIHFCSIQKRLASSCTRPIKIINISFIIAVVVQSPRLMLHILLLPVITLIIITKLLCCPRRHCHLHLLWPPPLLDCT